MSASPEAIPFRTTPDQVIELAAIVLAMEEAAIDRGFIAAASELARFDQGVFDLLALWRDTADANERAEIVADIQESLSDYEDAPVRPLQKPYIKFESLDDVARRVVEYKKHLRDLIDRNGGVSAVAQKSGIPQPSLSRMLNSASMPRRSTLYKIANAIDVAESEIVTEWAR
jgi:DNA-binding phage protein